MSETATKTRTGATAPQTDALQHLRQAIKDGRDWPTAMLEAIALWTAPHETYRGRRYDYFIAGEAFDWLLLAERLCHSADKAVPREEKEALLFEGRFPASFDASRFGHLLGTDKYRAYLNYFYGVTVEDSLQVATELEVHKRHAGNGVQYKDDCTEEAFLRIYRAPIDELLERFRGERGSPARRYLSLGEAKEFTYWLFKYRLQTSDKARTASDTRKGLEQLRRMSKEAEPYFQGDAGDSQDRLLSM